jgi:tRNA pseudouridine38-40 synthase
LLALCFKPEDVNHRYFLKMAYDGTAYNGWQIQPNGISVQEVTEKALAICLGTRTGITGAGRTDTGVHAREMFAHFDIERKLTARETEQCVWKLNNLLPSDIVISAVIPVHKEAHARYDALSRSYEYHILRRKDPFREPFAWYWQGKLDVEPMNRAAMQILGVHDFQCFSKVHTDVKHYLCNVMESRWQEEEGELVYTIRANRFLRNMVRAIVGTLFDIGRGKLGEDDLAGILESRNRSNAGASVPAKGLTLVGIEYPEGLMS